MKITENSGKKNKLVAVYIDHNPRINPAVRSAKRKAAQLGVGWIAIYVNNRSSRHLSATNKINLLNNIELVKILGGEVIELHEEGSISNIITKYVKDSFDSPKPVKYLILGYSVKRGFSFFKKPLYEKVIKTLEGICEVQLVPIKTIRAKSKGIKEITGNLILEICCGTILPLICLLLIKTICYFFGSAHYLLHHHNIFIIYLIMTVLSTIRFGLISGLVSAVLSFSLIHLLHLEHINDLNDLTEPTISISINLVLFIGISIVISLVNYANNYHREENFIKDRALKVINKISRIKPNTSHIGEISTLICKKLEEDLKGKFSLIVLGAGKIENYGEVKIDESYQDIIKNIFDSNTLQATYKANKILYFQPMSVDKDIGILVCEIDASDDATLKMGKILPVISDQIATILNNFQTKLLLDEAKVNEEREKLRSLILSSISHDLKTPLSTIIGSLGILLRLRDENNLDKENQITLIKTALEESQRLNSFISNILEMTRIESGAIKLNKEYLSPYPIIEKTLKRFEQKLKNYELNISLSENIKVNFDLISLEQIIQNLIDNTIKYSPKNTKITIYDELENNQIYKILIKDQGGGIEAPKLSYIFNKFERFTLKDKISGSGLGLSIVRALMESNGASILAMNSPDKSGAIFILNFYDFLQLNENNL